MLHTILHPEGYHGHQARPPFFEGWYYKLVDKTEQHRYAIIPGVSLNPGGDGPHAFVQVLDGVSGRTAYHVYPLTDFWAADKGFYVRIGPNHFTAASLKLDLPEDASLALKGEVAFYDMVPWPGTPLAPNIMSWYAWVPRMECYHGVVSLDHGIHGTLNVNGQSLTFTEGRGYIEKDWGQSFPAAWIWTQTNHFKTPGVSLTASVAHIPWLGGAFRGFIVGLLRDGILYRFATYTGAIIEKLDIAPDRVIWTLRDRLYRLQLTAHRQPGADLQGPSRAAMDRRVPETLQATVNVTLTTLAGDRVLFAETGRNAGLEIVGDLATLTTE